MSTYCCSRFLPLYNIGLGLPQSAYSKLFFRNTHHFSRFRKLLGWFGNGVESHLPGSPMHTHGLLGVLLSAYFSPSTIDQTHEIPKHPQCINGCIMNGRHLITRCVCSDRNEGEIERSESFTNLLESWTDWKRGLETVVLLVG
jgi:hypothetical protein